MTKHEEQKAIRILFPDYNANYKSHDSDEPSQEDLTNLDFLKDEPSEQIKKPTKIGQGAFTF